MEKLLSPCFGPNGLCVLLEGEDGHCFFPSNGVQLIDCIKLVGPANLIVSKATRQYEKATGDGSKKMVLVFTAALKEITSRCATLSVDDKALLFEVSQAVSRLKLSLPRACYADMTLRNAQKDKDEIYLQTSCCFTNCKDIPQIKSNCLKLLSTSLGNRFSFKTRRKLNELLIESVFLRDIRKGTAWTDLKELNKNLTCCQRDLDSNTFFHASLPVAESRVLPGFVVDRAFVVEPSLKVFQESVRMILLLSGLDLDVEEVTLWVNSKPQVQQTLAFADGYKRRLIDHLSNTHIRLLLCGGKISPGTAQLLADSDIAAVQMVPDETLIAIAEAAGSHPFPKAVDMFTWSSESSWVDGVCCRYETVGRKRYIHLYCVPPPSTGPPLMRYPRTYFLCAPTTGVCRSLARTLNQQLKVIENWFQMVDEESNGGPCLVALAGGGVWEVELIRQLKNRISTNNITWGSAEWIALNALIKGFLAVPQTLYNNSLPSAKKQVGRANQLLYHRIFDSSQDSSRRLVGVDTLHGCVKELDTESITSWPAWEPFWAQQHLFYSVCELLSQVLRIDRVMEVPRSALEQFNEHSSDTINKLDSDD